VTRADLADLQERARNTLAFQQTAKREDFLPNAVGNAALLGLGQAITGWITGLDEDEVMPVIRRARDWLEDSVERDEQFLEQSFAVLRMEALGVACWLTGEPSDDRFRDALALEPDLTAYVRDCALAKEFERGPAAHPAPRSEDDVTTPLDLAAWICAHQAFQAPTAARVLHDPLVEWLTHGQGVNAAAWIKLIFCDFGPERRPADAFRTVRKFVS
jgi:hypothetical protein